MNHDSTVPDVSVVIPARNAAATLAATLRSVLGQDRLAEVIVVNDGSTDGTAAVAAAAADARVRVIAGPGSGIAAALNAGLRAASGRYVARCDADDLFLPERLSRQAAWLDAHPDQAAVSGGFRSIDSRGRDLACLACDGAARDVTGVLQGGAAVTSLCTFLMRRTAVLATGGARPWFETSEDLDLQVRLAFQGVVWHDPAPVYGYRLHDGSITHSRKAGQLAFFDAAVRTFAAQRRDTGTDDLDRGDPPPVPDFAASGGPRNSVGGHVAGHLLSQGWKDFAEGRRAAGIRRLLQAAALRPTHPEAWKGLLVMLGRSLRRR